MSPSPGWASALRLPTPRVLVQWADLAGARGDHAVARLVQRDARAARWGSGGSWRAVWRQTACRGPRRSASPPATASGASERLPLRAVGTITLIQPNIGFHEKWDPARADSEVATLLDLSREASPPRRRVDLVIWPEAALPDYLTQRPDWQAAIGHLAAATRTPVLTGGIHVVFRETGVVPDLQRRLLVRLARVWPAAIGRVTKSTTSSRRGAGAVRPGRAGSARFPGLGRWSGGFGRGASLPLYDDANRALRCARVLRVGVRRPATPLSAMPGRRFPGERHQRRLVRPHLGAVSARLPPGAAGHRNPDGYRPGRERRHLRIRRSVGTGLARERARDPHDRHRHPPHQRRAAALRATRGLGRDAVGAGDARASPERWRCVRGNGRA